MLDPNHGIAATAGAGARPGHKRPLMSRSRRVIELLVLQLTKTFLEFIQIMPV